MPKAVIFTEGGAGPGFGHAVRCSVLKRAFERAGIRTRLIVQGDASVAGVLGRGYTAGNWRGGTVPAAAAGADIAVIDSYLAGVAIYRKIAGAVRHCFYMDDNARLDYPAGTVVNYNAHAAALKYPAARGAARLLGTRYAPLREEFCAVPGRAIREKMSRVFLMFGGADKTGLAGKVLEFLAENHPGLKATVVAGDSGRGLERFRGTGTEIIRAASAAKVRELMLDCDLAFTAGGVTLYELAATGTPAIVFCTAENQRQSAAAMAEAGTVIQAGAGGRFLASELEKLLARVRPAAARKKMSAAGRVLVDGQGAGRLARYALALLLDDAIKLRRASAGDMRAVHKLSNEPAVRRCSISGGKISLGAHKEWFAGKLADPSQLFLVAVYKGKFAGQVRFAPEKKAVVISISVTGALRGTGAGGVILRKAMDFLRREKPGIKTVLAYIKPGNIPSRKLFEKAGFKKIRVRRSGGVRLGLYRKALGV